MYNYTKVVSDDLEPARKSLQGELTFSTAHDDTQNLDRPIDRHTNKLPYVNGALCTKTQCVTLNVHI